MKHDLLIGCISFFSVVILSLFSGYALSQSDTAHPTLPVAVPVDVYSGVVGCDINGYVLDTNGSPVSNAVVTVRLNGQVLNSSGGINGNPETSSIYSYGIRGDVGHFDFIVYNKGQYTLTAEIDGYNSSVDVLVTNIVIGNSVSKNITLNGYHAPVPLEDQLAYAGAITGVVLDRNGVHLSVTNVSLWQDGRLVRIPNNPQYSAGGKDEDEYLFQHVPPGHYTLLADETERLGDIEGVTIDIDNKPVTANITMHNYTYFSMAPPITPIPSQMQSDNTSKPSPFPAGLIIALSICIAAIISMHKKMS